MIPTDEARRIIGEKITATTRTEALPLDRVAGRVLARDAVSDVDMPPFNRATMDGYAILSSDGAGEREVIEYVPAGAYPEKRITSGKAARIMTGAPVPDGADAVIQVEKTKGFIEVGGKAMINEAPAPGSNIAPQGEDVKTGDIVLKAGAFIGAAEAAVLAATGHDPVEVLKAPGVAILSTGDELVPPCEKPGPGQIRNSNAYSLNAQIRALGVEPVILSAAGDDEKALYEKISQGAPSDFLIVSGGVSAGDRDLVIPVLEKTGYEIFIKKIRIKPGKPTVFGVRDRGGYVFGVPGNPVSSMVIFELFIKPAIRKFMGAPYERGLRVNASLAGDFRRKSGAREEYVPVNLSWDGEGFIAKLLPYHGSGHIHALTGANALLRIPVGVTEMRAGSRSDAVFLREIA